MVSRNFHYRTKIRLWETMAIMSFFVGKDTLLSVCDNIKPQFWDRTYCILVLDSKIRALIQLSPSFLLHSLPFLPILTCFRWNFEKIIFLMIRNFQENRTLFPCTMIIRLQSIVKYFSHRRILVLWWESFHTKAHLKRIKYTASVAMQSWPYFGIEARIWLATVCDRHVGES